MVILSSQRVLMEVASENMIHFYITSNILFYVKKKFSTIVG